MAQRRDLAHHFILTTLTDAQLSAILKCQTWAEFNALEEVSPLLRRALFARAKKSSVCPAFLGRHKISDVILDLMTPLSYLYLIPDTVFTLTTMSLSSFMMVSSLFNGIMLATVVVYGISNHLESKRNEEETRDQFLLLALQNFCADRLLDKKTVSLKDDWYAYFKLTYSRHKKLNVPLEEWSWLKEATLTMLIVTSISFYTYYAHAFALSSIFSTSTMMLALVSPALIGAAVAATFLIGCAIGMLKYQQMKDDHYIQELLAAEKNKIEMKEKGLSAAEEKKFVPSNVVHNKKLSFINEKNQRRMSANRLEKLPSFFPLHGKSLRTGSVEERARVLKRT